MRLCRWEILPVLPLLLPPPPRQEVLACFSLPQLPQPPTIASPLPTECDTARAGSSLSVEGPLVRMLLSRGHLLRLQV